MANATSAPDEGRHPASRIGYLYNPYEVGVAGGSETDRAALIDALCSGPLSAFTVYRGTESVVSRPFEAPSESLEADLVLTPCSIDSTMNKILWVGDGKAAKSPHVLAHVGRPSACPVLPSHSAYFTTGQLDELAAHVVAHLRSRGAAVPLHGLVLVGGKSERMGRDKSALVYREKPQAHAVYEMVDSICERSWVSCRADQRGAAHLADLPLLDDRFLDLGPSSGILSALTAYPDAAWLVVACDLPFLSVATLKALVAQRDPFRMATAYGSAERGFPEPLCTIYEPKSVHRMLRFLGLGYPCPRKVLINSRIALLDPPAGDALSNANSPEEYAAAKSGLEKEAVGHE